MEDHEAGIQSRKGSTIVSSVSGSYNTGCTTNHGNYNTTHNNHYYETSDQESSSTALSSRAAFSALHNSEARYPQPNVLPGTREKIIQELIDWVEDRSADKSRVHWVNAAAGVGKSAIAQALSEKYTQTQQLAAAFFFSRNDASRDKLEPFIPTIAHQLITSPTLKPLLMPLVDDAIRSTPGIWERNWEDQFKVIIQEPCARVHPSEWEALPRLVIIDGVDECVDMTSQKRLLETIKASTPSLPFDFLIFSRPEPLIKRIFHDGSFVPAPRIMSLGDYAVRDDIEKYLRKEFDRLREEHKGTVPVSWPGEDVIMVLVDRSTGQFIYVTTVIKYLSTGKVPVTPQQRLEVVRRAEPVSNSTSPYPDLDQLYSQILHFCQNDGRKLQRVLQLIVSPIDLGFPDFFRLKGSPRMEPTSAVAIEQLLGLGQGEVTALFSGLHSILHIPEDRAEGISVLHASFTDFLLDCNRSGDYHVGKRIRARAWKEMVVVYQAKWLSRLSAGHRSTPSLEGAYDHVLGSLNLWPFLHSYLRNGDIAVTDEIAEALNGFDPHLYLEMILHWNYQCHRSDEFVWEVSTENRYGCQDRGTNHNMEGVTTQIEMLYVVFHLLKQRRPRKLHDFVKRCKSFLRGFHVAFPRDHWSPSLFLSCQLAISHYWPEFLQTRATIGRPRHIINPIQSHSGTTFRIFPLGQTKRGIPPMWDMEYVSPVRGQLLLKLFDRLLVEDDGSAIESQITHVISSDKTEDWPRNLAMLNWGKTWRTYIKYQQLWYKLYDVFRKDMESLLHRHRSMPRSPVVQRPLSPDLLPLSSTSE
ncbi:hypothetical protein PM082_003421 [Marasmius tenuissimus]|nr:hypothetical protein PM082_003421 [Marasmius tenuissimus]